MGRPAHWIHGRPLAPRRSRAGSTAPPRRLLGNARAPHRAPRAGPVDTGTLDDPDLPRRAADEPTAQEPTEEPTQDRHRTRSRVAALAAADLTGGDLRLGAVRERTTAYTSYDVTFASTTAGEGTTPLRISGVLNVPTGRGPFPAVVLAHGYIDPAVYVRGQGMTRERGFLAQRGFVALHVDYRNHAESTDDPRVETAVRLGYSADVVAAAHALRDSGDVRIDPDRIALFGRSMGGGVMLKALAAEPGLFAAGVGWASVSSLEAENFDQFQRPDAPLAELEAGFRGRHGLPGEDPAFWRGVSVASGVRPDHRAGAAGPRPLRRHLPAPWARATQRALHDGRRRLRPWSGTTTGTRSDRRSSPRWTAPCGSSAQRMSA